MGLGQAECTDFLFILIRKLPWDNALIYWGSLEILLRIPTSFTNSVFRVTPMFYSFPYFTVETPKVRIPLSDYWFVSTDCRWKMIVIQRPMEKRTTSQEIFLEGRLSLTGIDIKIPKKKSVMKVENPSGGQISVSSWALQVWVPVCAGCLPGRLHRHLLLFEIALRYYSVCVSVYMGVYTCAVICMPRSEDNLQDLVFSFYSVGLRHRT